jgi:quercetin dioxygenase-like cupin family protein
MIYPGVIRNWRDQEPANSHGAVGWKILTERDLNGLPYEIAPLKGIHGITFRMLQPGKKEPAHVHDTKEHVYYITKGRGKVQLGDDVFDVQEGDAVFMPAQGVHSIINDSEDFIEHLVISAIAHWASSDNGSLLDRGRIDPVIRNWRSGAPHMSHGAVGWSILAEKAYFPDRGYERAPLEGFHALTMHMMPGGQQEGPHEHVGKEQVYYFTQGKGKMLLGDEVFTVRDGDAAYIPPNTQHAFINDGHDWVTHLIISALVPSE